MVLLTHQLSSRAALPTDRVRCQRNNRARPRCVRASCASLQDNVERGVQLVTEGYTTKLQSEDVQNMLESSSSVSARYPLIFSCLQPRHSSAASSSCEQQPLYEEVQHNK
ncbi:hypothetical protein CYMTET_31321 [Cymbomonas tetramitiformis]|uniref:Uncharacterized protein n=1 Tax=Cymbomonas tetramitiformis TaxID=36881 RepID=A0AAE0FHG9_9CHLO|nr:hypothetical protein CYMTET_31321 [Cymbomonas tetramitiformis]